MRRAIPASEFIRLGVYDAHDAQFDFGGLNALLPQELQDRLSVRFGLRIDRLQVVAGLFVIDGPYGKIGFDRALCEPADGDIPITEVGSFDLCSQRPTTEDQPESQQQPK